MLDALLEAGVDVCRLNFSHGRLDEHLRVLQHVRAWSARQNRAVAVLGDLCGPKIRLNTVRGGAFELNTGDALAFVRGEHECTPARLTTNYARFVDEVLPGHRIYINDGLVRLLAVDRTADEIRCTCLAGGRVSDRKGVNLPDTPLSVPALTPKDHQDLDWAIRNDLDYVALSFVRRPGDVDQLRAIIQERDSALGIVVKIEMVEALHNLDEIILRADAVMAARGDLGVEMDVWQVPVVQKRLTARCRQVGKPIIIATQMLQAMVDSPSPTRAEVSDVANAILDQVDAVMLSAESAAGRFPRAAVEMMRLIAGATEELQTAQALSSSHAERERACAATVSAANPRVSAIACAAVEAVRHTRARLVAVWTATGETARLIAQQRLAVPVIGLTSDERVFRRLNLLYGVTPVRVPPHDHPGRLSAGLDRILRDRGLAQPGDVIVVATSTHPTQPGETDTLLVHRVA